MAASNIESKGGRRRVALSLLHEIKNVHRVRYDALSRVFTTRYTVPNDVTVLRDHSALLHSLLIPLGPVQFESHDGP